MFLAADLLVRSLHLIAAAIWAGGLVFLGLAAVASRRTLDAESRIRFFRAVGRRFAVVGGVALAVLIATGIDMGSDRHVWDDLGATEYGRTLRVKVVLVALVVLLTLLHSAVQGPALSRLREQAVARPDDAELQAAIRRRAARAGVVSALTLVATLAILVLAAKLVTG